MIDTKNSSKNKYSQNIKSLLKLKKNNLANKLKNNQFFTNQSYVIVMLTTSF